MIIIITLNKSFADISDYGNSCSINLLNVIYEYALVRNLPIEDKLKMRYINEISEQEKRVPVSPIKSQPPTVNDKPTFNV